MRRREFITLLGGAAVAWPLAARGQQTTMPVIGFLNPASPDGLVDRLRGFRQGLKDIEQGVTALAAEPDCGLIVAPHAVTLGNRKLIIELAARHHLPAIYNDRYFAQSGRLLSFGNNTDAMFRRAASYIDLILKGASPADLPVQLPTKFELVVNLKTAKTLGLEIPPALLARADQVIE
jgi:ABC-type uncharacterized transport system substrate-binding protein